MIGIGTMLAGVAKLGAGGFIMSLPVVGPVLAFLFSPLGRVLGVAAIAGAIFLTGYIKGENKAEERCEAAALKAKLAVVTLERDAAFKRAADAAQRMNDMQKQRSSDEAEIAALNKIISTHKAQSTQEGAKHDPNALFDDRCNLTPLGERWLRGKSGPRRR